MTSESNVIPFKNIGMFIEELVQFTGANGGNVMLHFDPETAQWTINLRMGERVIAKQGDTMNETILSCYRVAAKLANGT